MEDDPYSVLLPNNRHPYGRSSGLRPQRRRTARFPANINQPILPGPPLRGVGDRQLHPNLLHFAHLQPQHHLHRERNLRVYGNRPLCVYRQKVLAAVGDEPELHD